MELSSWFDSAAISPWNLAFAVATVVVGWICSNIARRGVLAGLARLRGLRPDTQLLIARIVKYAIVLLALGIAFGFLGAPIQPLLAMAIVVAIVLVLALRGIADNFAAGVVLQTRQPIHVGDEVESGDLVGVVNELNGRSVVVTTADGRVAHIPNSDLLENPLINRSAGGRRRSEVEVRLVLDAARQADVVRSVHEVVSASDGVLEDEPVQVLTVLVSNDRLTLRVRFWHDPFAAPQTCSDVVAGLARALRADVGAFTVTSALPTTALTVAPPT